MSNDKKYLLCAVLGALVIKLALFSYTRMMAPESIFMPDTPTYLKSAEMMADKGAFALSNEKGGLVYETLRTPGYPLFLAVFHYGMKIPLGGIILLQVLMTMLAGFVVYKAAAETNRWIALVAAVIVLYDPPITIFSQMILTETLFLLLVSVFMLKFTEYLKDKNIKTLIIVSLILAAGAYVRPIAYYLGLAVSAFIVYAGAKEDMRKGIFHAAVMLAIVYSLLGAWQVRNYIRCGDWAFSSIASSNAPGFGLVGSYARNTDPATQGMAPIPYYVNVTARCLMSFMTRPGNLKYFDSPVLTVAGKILFYPWMAIWLAGFIAGVAKARRNILLQAYLFIILYFVSGSIVNIMWLVGERFRAPIMPFIAVISAYGWISIISFLRTSRLSKMLKPFSSI